MGGCVSQPVQLYCTVDFTPLGDCHGEYHARGGMRPGAEVINQSQQQHHEHQQSQQHEATPAAPAAPTSTPASPTRQNVAATATAQMPAARAVPEQYKAPPPGLACSTNSTSTRTPPPATAQAHHHQQQCLGFMRPVGAFLAPPAPSSTTPPDTTNTNTNTNTTNRTAPSLLPETPQTPAENTTTTEHHYNRTPIPEPAAEDLDVQEQAPPLCKPPPAGFTRQTWNWNEGHQSCAGCGAVFSAPQPATLPDPPFGPPPEPDPPFGPPPGVASSLTHAALDWAPRLLQSQPKPPPPAPAQGLLQPQPQPQPQPPPQPQTKKAPPQRLPQPWQPEPTPATPPTPGLAKPPPAKHPPKPWSAVDAARQVLPIVAKMPPAGEPSYIIHEQPAVPQLPPAPPPPAGDPPSRHANNTHLGDEEDEEDAHRGDEEDLWTRWHREPMPGRMPPLMPNWTHEV